MKAIFILWCHGNLKYQLIFIFVKLFQNHAIP